MIFLLEKTKRTHCFKFTQSKKKIEKGCQVKQIYKKQFSYYYKLYLSRRNDEKKFPFIITKSMQSLRITLSINIKSSWMNLWNVIRHKIKNNISNNNNNKNKICKKFRKLNIFWIKRLSVIKVHSPKRNL